MDFHLSHCCGSDKKGKALNWIVREWLLRHLACSMCSLQTNRCLNFRHPRKTFRFLVLISRVFHADGNHFSCRSTIIKYTFTNFLQSPWHLFGAVVCCVLEQKERNVEMWKNRFSRIEQRWKRLRDKRVEIERERLEKFEDINFRNQNKKPRKKQIINFSFPLPTARQ